MFRRCDTRFRLANEILGFFVLDSDCLPTRIWFWVKFGFFLCIKIGFNSVQCIKIGYSSAQCIKKRYSSAQCIKIGYSSAMF